LKAAVSLLGLSTGLLLAACTSLPESPPNSAAAPADPFPLSPEMELLDRDIGSEEYRRLLRAQSGNVNVLNAEWQRVAVRGNAESFARENGGADLVQADPALRIAYVRRKEIEEKFLAILREEYAFRKNPAPFDEGATAGAGPKEGPKEGTARGDPAIAIEPIFSAPGAERHWPGWRGPGGQGLTADTGLPERWSPSENIAWSTEIPGAGNSSPVIWGDRIFLTTSFESGKRRSLVAVSRLDGKVLYVCDAPASAPEGRVIAKNGFASATPVTDGRIVVAFFGNTGLVAFNFDGKVIWRRPLGPFDAMHGTGASPVMCGELVILFQEQSSKPSIGVAVDKRNGQVRWNLERSPALGWSTPLAVRIGGREELIYGATNALVSFDPSSGRELWRSSGPTHEVIPTVVCGHGLIFSASGRVGPMLALRAGGIGDISASHLVWRSSRGAPHVPSPILVGERLYQVNDMGILTCFTARSGEVLYQKRIGGTFSASPVAGDGKVYITSEDGDTTVLADGPELKVLSVNPLQETTLASMAVLKKQLFIRTQKHLYAIGGEGAATRAAAAGAGSGN